jgi:hypothetical protein
MSVDKQSPYSPSPIPVAFAASCTHFSESTRAWPSSFFNIAGRLVKGRLSRIFCCTNYPSVILHFPSYMITRTILVHLDNNLLWGRKGSEASID